MCAAAPSTADKYGPCIGYSPGCAPYECDDEDIRPMQTPNPKPGTNSLFHTPSSNAASGEAAFDVGHERLSARHSPVEIWLEVLVAGLERPDKDHHECDSEYRNHEPLDDGVWPDGPCDLRGEKCHERP